MQRGRIQWEFVATGRDCGADRPDAPALEGTTAFNFTLPLSLRGDGPYPPRCSARRASARPISTKAEVTSGPPTRMRVGVFILFHS